MTAVHVFGLLMMAVTIGAIAWGILNEGPASEDYRSRKRRENAEWLTKRRAREALRADMARRDAHWKSFPPAKPPF